MTGQASWFITDLRTEYHSGPPRELRISVPFLPPRLELGWHPAAEMWRRGQRELWRQTIEKAVRDLPDFEPFEEATLYIVPHKHRPQDPANYDDALVAAGLRAARKYLPDTLQAANVIVSDAHDTLVCVTAARSLSRQESEFTLLILREGLLPISERC